MSKPAKGSSMNLQGESLGALRNAAPLASLLKALVDPVLVVILLYALASWMDVSLHGQLLTWATIAFLLAALLMDGTFLLMPGSHGSWLGVGRMMATWLFICFVLYCYARLAGLVEFFPDELMLGWAILTPLLLLGMHWVIRMVIVRPASDATQVTRVVVVGANKSGCMLAQRIRQNPQLRMEFMGYFDDRGLDRVETIGEDELKGTIAELYDFVKANGVHQIYISLPMTSQPRVMTLVDGLMDCTASIYFVPDLFVFDLIQAQIDHVAGFPVMTICESPFIGLAGVVKRMSDVVLALCILALIWPVMLGVALAVKLTSSGPVLFKQRRYGANGESILVYKFRSMKVMEDGDKVVQATRHDSRLTPIGGFIRKSSLDELPQFLNVLEGKMSIVGPRPHANAHNEMYRKLIKGYMLRHKVKPGITGWAQVNGYRGETDTIEKMERRIEYDLDYLRNWSLWFDLKIILMTVTTLFRDKNAY